MRAYLFHFEGKGLEDETVVVHRWDTTRPQRELALVTLNVFSDVEVGQEETGLELVPGGRINRSISVHSSITVFDSIDNWDWGGGC